MRILLITKRQYTSKDLIDDKYGRLREIPLELAARGHEIFGYCLSYQRRQTGHFLDKNKKVHVDWTSMNSGIIKPLGFALFALRVLSAAKNIRPDLVMASSDSIYGVLGVWLSRRLNIPCVFDLYDNYESFAAIHFPGVKQLYRRALENADLVTCVSDPLREYVRNNYRPDLPILTLINGTDPDIFTSLDRDECRTQLGLPLTGTIIGVTGAISSSRGIEDLFRAYEILRKQIPDLYLVLAGTIDKGLTLPSSPNVIYLGLLPQKVIPYVINSLDVSVICNKDSAFGRYCFPQKLVEVISCGASFVATNIGTTNFLLSNYPALVYEPGDSQQLAKTIIGQLDNKIAPEIMIKTWSELAGELDNAISGII